MLFHIRRVVTVAAAVVLIGCGDQVVSVGEIVVTEADSAGVRMVTISGPVNALPEWSLSPTPLTEISGNDPPFLGRVGQVAFLGEDQLLVQDGQTDELRSFSAEGQVLQSLARSGDGPGEFRLLTALSVTPGDTIYAFDGRLMRVSVFGPDGAFLNTIPVRPESAGPGTLVRTARALGSDRFLLHGYGLGSGESGSREGAPHRVVRDAIIQVVTADGTDRAPQIRFPGGSVVRYAGGTVSGFTNRPFVSVNATRILYGSGLTYELFLMDSDLQPLVVIRWPGWQRPLTASMIKALRDPRDTTLHELRAVAPAAADQVTDALFHPSALPEVLPALGSVRLDENGRIWVRTFLPPENVFMLMNGLFPQWREEDAWHVLDSDGSPIARVRLPSKTRLMAVRGDRVAVVTRDSLDVEHVRVLAINALGGAR